MTTKSVSKKDTLALLAPMILAITGLLGVVVYLYLQSHSSRWDNLAAYEEVDHLRAEMVRTEARIQQMTEKAKQVEELNREMTASFLNHVGVGPLSPGETPEAVALVEASDVPELPEAMTGRMETLGDHLGTIYQRMLDRAEYSRAIPTLAPTSGWVSSHFGSRNSPFTGKTSVHNGIDIAAPSGTPIYAAADGIVGFAGRFGGYGKYVLINHGFGIVTRYGHVKKYFVYPGQHIKRGHKIAEVGSTGRSTGSHLHFEVRIANRAVDPRPFMLDAGQKILGDLWEIGEDIPRTPLPDFAPMGGDPDEEAEAPAIVTDMTVDATQPPKTEPATETKPAAVTIVPTANRPQFRHELEALKLMIPWLVVGMSLMLLVWSIVRITLRLRSAA